MPHTRAPCSSSRHRDRRNLRLLRGRHLGMPMTPRAHLLLVRRRRRPSLSAPAALLPLLALSMVTTTAAWTPVPTATSLLMISLLLHRARLGFRISVHDVSLLTTTNGCFYQRNNLSRCIPRELDDLLRRLRGRWGGPFRFFRWRLRLGRNRGWRHGEFRPSRKHRPVAVDVRSRRVGEDGVCRIRGLPGR